MQTPFLRAVYGIALKDLRAELRSRELLSLMLIFALLSLLIFSFALELDRIAREESISGVLWVTVAFASIIGLNRSLTLEREQGSLDAMLIAPIHRAAIFVGKLIGNFLFALIVGALLLPIAALLYNLPSLSLWLIGALVLGTLGLSSIGTLLATMTAQTRTRESLLPIVMLPLALPIVLTAVRATTGILSGQPSGDWLAWLQLLAFVDAVYFAACFVMFEFVVEA
ncbi:MAG: heme exporter protein CcmB [Aggregatilineales bacterium]